MSQVNRLAKYSRHTLCVLVGAQRIECGVLRGAGSRAKWIGDSVLDVAIDAVDGAERPIQAFLTALQRLQALPALPAVDDMRVVVADRWLAVAGVPWSPKLKISATAAPYARAQLAGAGFEIEPGDTLKLDDAPFGAPRLAIAYPAALLAAMDQMAVRLNARLTSILPLSVAAWALVQRKGDVRPQALAVLDAGLIVLARGAGGGRARLSDVSVRMNAGDHTSDEQSLREVWQRLCLRDPQLAGVEQVALLDLIQPDGASKRPADQPFVQVHLPTQGDTASPGLSLAVHALSLHDPLDARPGTSTLSPGLWLVLGASALLAGAMLVQALQTNSAIISFTARLNAAQSAAQPAPRPMSWSREELARVQAVNAAIRELNLPISPILRALAPPPDMRVAVLSVDTTGSFSPGQPSGVKIVAEARTGAEMARYVSFVGQRKPFTGAYLTRHEIVEAAAERTYLFTVEALWNE